VDIWAGLQQPVRLTLQPILAGLDRTGLRETEKNIDVLDASRRFLSYKLSPAVTLPAELLTGKTIVGEKRAWDESALRAIAPLVIEQTVDVYRNSEDAPKTAATAAAAFVGVGVNEQAPRN
jgi:hypothetical protein